MELTIDDIVASGAQRSIRLVGTLDLSTRDDLLAAATAALAEPGAEALVVNMADVTFMDSTGIGALIRVSTDTSSQGAAFTVQDPSDRVRRVLHFTGLLQVWNIETSTTG